MQMTRWALCLGLAGCCASPVPVPPVPPDPPAAQAQPAPSPRVSDTEASKTVKRDSGAVKAQARQLIVQPSVPVEVVKQLEPLTHAVNRALAVMELHHSRGGYRAVDVIRARDAADAVARFIDAQPPPRAAAEPAGAQP